MTPSTYLDQARRYEDDVRSGRLAACKWVRLACERNARDRERALRHDPDFPYTFDETAGARVCYFAEQLPHIKGPKAKVIGQDEDGRSLWATIQLEPWQCWLLTTIFGWKRLSDGLRRFRVALVMVPRKNAKSTLGAIVVLYMLTADGEGGPNCFSAATTRDQAKVVAEIAWEMAKRRPDFREYYGVRMGAKTNLTLEVPATAGKFSPLSADAHSLDGLNISLAVVDELHAHKTRQVWDVIETATGSRAQPLLFTISTAGADTGGICYEQLSYVQKVLEGDHTDESYFGVNWTIDEGDDWRDLATLAKANPNYGVSVQPDDLERKVTKATQSQAAINNFLTKHLNVWVRGDATWMPMAEWIACGDASLRIEDCREWPCWIGVDLAETRDIAAVITLFRKPDLTFVVFGRYYLPQDMVERSPVAQYSGWVRSGWLTVTEGNVADYQRIQDDIVQLCLTYQVQEVDFDRALAAQMAQQLESVLGSDPKVVSVSQNLATMNPSMQKLEELVLSGKLRHAADPVLTWMASNVVTYRNDKDEVYPRKAGGKDSHNKIDGIVALLTALSRVSVPAEPQPSYQMVIL